MLTMHGHVPGPEDDDILSTLQGPDEWADIAHAALEGAGLRAGDVALHVGRHFSMRDVLKWCQRMQVPLSTFF